jgi:hypothetical protein
MTPEIDVTLGHVFARVHEPGKMYLGLEHSTRQRKNGYVLVGLADAIHTALLAGEKNPTFTRAVVPENEIVGETGKVIDAEYGGGLTSLPAPEIFEK